MAKNPSFYYAVLAARIGGEDIRVYKVGPYKSQYDPKLVQKVERLFPPADWNVLLIKRLHDSDFGRTPGGWLQRYEYRNSKKPFNPTSGVIYETINGSTFLCLYSGKHFAIMQSTEPHKFLEGKNPEKPYFWTKCVRDIVIYEDGKINWPADTVWNHLPCDYAEYGSTELITGTDLKNVIKRKED